MQYGWYLLDEAKRQLIRSSTVLDVVPYGPLHVEFQPVGLGGACMDYHRFRELVDELTAMNLISVRLAGQGDPLAHPHSIEMLQYLSAAGVVIDEVQTDAAVLDQRLVDIFLQIKVHTVIARFDAGPKNGDGPDPAPINLQHLHDERVRRGVNFPSLVCKFSVTPANFRGVGEMVSMARELDAAGVIIDLPDAPDGPASLQSLNPSEIEILEQQVAAVKDANGNGFISGNLFADEPGALVPGSPNTSQEIDYAAQVGFGVNHRSGSRTSRWAGDRHCYIPWYHMLVDSNFDVWPCRFLSGKQFRSLGNVRNEAAASVWNGPRAREYRAEFTSAILDRPITGSVYLCDKCVSCNLRETLADDSFYRETENWYERQRAGMSAPIFARETSREGFAHPALRHLRERFPRYQFPAGSLETVERIHAEAEIAREESLRLAIKCSELEVQAKRLLHNPLERARSEKARIEAEQIRKTVRELDAFAQSLFQEAHLVGGAELVAEAPSPLVSMHEWLLRLQEFDPSIDAEVDLTYLIWASHFKTLTENVEMAAIQRVLGVGVGFDGPEVNYNDHFPEHYCLDLVDYSDRNPKLKFVTANIEERVPFPDGTFDLIYSHSVFEHLKNVRKAITEIDRLLRLGRYAYITVSPLYYSPSGSHVNVPSTLEHWEHLYPNTEYYLLDSPHPTLIDEGVFLNKMTIAEFLTEVGRVGWEILHFSIRIVHPRDVPAELKSRYPLVDLVAQEYRFIGRKIIPKSDVEY